MVALSCTSCTSSLDEDAREIVTTGSPSSPRSTLTTLMSSFYPLTQPLVVTSVICYKEKALRLSSALLHLASLPHHSQDLPVKRGQRQGICNPPLVATAVGLDRFALKPSHGDWKHSPTESWINFRLAVRSWHPMFPLRSRLSWTTEPQSWSTLLPTVILIIRVFGEPRCSAWSVGVHPAFNFLKLSNGAMAPRLSNRPRLGWWACHHLPRFFTIQPCRGWLDLLLLLQDWMAALGSSTPLRRRSTQVDSAGRLWPRSLLGSLIVGEIRVCRFEIFPSSKSGTCCGCGQSRLRHPPALLPHSCLITNHTGKAMYSLLHDSTRHVLTAAERKKSSYSYYFHIIQKEQFRKIIFISSPRRSAIDNTVLRNVFFPWEVWQGGPRWIKYKNKINSNQLKLIEIDYIPGFKFHYTLNFKYVLYVFVCFVFNQLIRMMNACIFGWHMVTHDWPLTILWSVFCLDAGRLEICWWAACFGSTFRGCCPCVNAASLKSEAKGVGVNNGNWQFGEIWRNLSLVPGFALVLPCQGCILRRLAQHFQLDVLRLAQAVNGSITSNLLIVGSFSFR